MTIKMTGSSIKKIFKNLKNFGGNVNDLTDEGVYELRLDNLTVKERIEFIGKCLFMKKYGF